MSSVIPWTYSLKLTKDSQTYSRKCSLDNSYYEAFYYEALEVNVPEIRYYTIQSSSNIDTYGYIYESSFNPLNPTENLLADDDNGGASNRQFKLHIPLYVHIKYILIVTTYWPKDIGEVDITLLGVNNVTVTRLSE
jgi:hypothetical protein